MRPVSVRHTMDRATGWTKLAWVVITLIVGGVWGHSRPVREVTDEAPFSYKEDWWENGQSELYDSIRHGFKNRVAKNVILFIGDGMGVSTVSAARIYQAQLRGLNYKDAVLAWENFPYTALTRTYNTDRHVADSAGTATAFLCGEKTRSGLIGTNQHTVRSNCTSERGNGLKSILKHAQDKGKWTGVVTTTRITHATPASAFATSCDRDWETDADIPESERGLGCKDIAAQLIDDDYGKDIRVIFGGGRKKFLPKDQADPEGDGRAAGQREDFRDLTRDWLAEKLNRGYLKDTVAYVEKQEDFDNVDPTKTEFVMGLFEADHMHYEILRRDPAYEQWGEPSLAEMTEKAIRILSKRKEGYFLLVEGGRIDHGHHDNWAVRALNETVALSDAVQIAARLTSDLDTQIVVTADHSHAFTLNGYANIGENILMIAGEGADMKPYTSMGYTNGPGWMHHRNGQPRRDINRDLNDGTLGSPNYRYDAGVHLNSETHGGEDIPVYARGPMAHLFKGVRQQHFVAHAMMYASCVGTNQELCNIGPESPGCPSAGSFNSINYLWLLLPFVSYCAFNR